MGTIPENIAGTKQRAHFIAKNLFKFKQKR